ncbi:MAG: CDP-alcohol phosphatidyltransferase family protein [Kiritimatiellae bacterium]|nr:CDP-alcohol phosphatidyltransferase family protein [Kiritimatiellia bacterium]
MRRLRGPRIEVIVGWRQIVPTAFTLAAMLAGFLSILVTVEGMRIAGTEFGDPSKHYRWAAKLIMLAMILDGIDGNLARWLRGSSPFGAELDTYVDLTAFGIAPAILVFAATLQSRNPTWRVLLPSAVALSGCVRLARFKVRDPLRGQGGYGGLPITVNAAWVSLFIFITLLPPYERFSLQHGPVAVLFLTGIIVFIVLQVTNFRYPKPTKHAAMFIPCLILVTALFLPNPWAASRAAVLIIALGVLYVVVGPLFMKGVAAHKARREARELESREFESEEQDNGS